MARSLSEGKEMGLAGKLRTRCSDRTCIVHLHVYQVVLWLSGCLRRCGLLITGDRALYLVISNIKSGQTCWTSGYRHHIPEQMNHKLASISLPVRVHNHKSSSSLCQALTAEQLEVAGTPGHLGTGPEARGSFS